MAFRAAAWWDLLATFDPDSFEARLVSVDGRRVATGPRLRPRREARTDARQLDEDEARGLASRLDGASFRVTKVEEKPYSRKPAAPFMTSTLQQEASRKLKFTAQTTDAPRAAPLRERLHHVHAHRLDDPVGVGARRGAPPGG
jgi:DNA topoisomerase-1